MATTLVVHTPSNGPFPSVADARRENKGQRLNMFLHVDLLKAAPIR